MSLQNNHNRLAAKVVENAIREVLADEFGVLNAMHHVRSFHHRDIEVVRNRLEVLANRFERDSDLPERVIDWKVSL